MLEHLNRRRSQPRRTLAGLAVSVAVHGALLALLVYGVSLAGGAGRRSQDTASSGRPGSASGIPGRAGAGAPQEPAADDVPMEPEWATPVLDLAAAGLGPRTEARLPDTLELGRPVPIRFVLPPEPAPEDSLHRVLLSGGPRTVRLSRTRGAFLRAGGMVIEHRAPALQLVDSARPTEWLWRVTPTAPGTQPLELRLDAVAEVDGARQVVTLASLGGEVVVRETPVQRASRFFSHHWTWLSLLTVVALVGWGRAALRVRSG